MEGRCETGNLVSWFANFDLMADDPFWEPRIIRSRSSLSPNQIVFIVVLVGDWRKCDLHGPDIHPSFVLWLVLISFCSDLSSCPRKDPSTWAYIDKAFPHLVSYRVWAEELWASSSSSSRMEIFLFIVYPLKSSELAGLPQGSCLSPMAVFRKQSLKIHLFSSPLGMLFTDAPYTRHGTILHGNEEVFIFPKSGRVSNIYMSWRKNSRKIITSPSLVGWLAQHNLCHMCGCNCSNLTRFHRLLMTIKIIRLICD